MQIKFGGKYVAPAGVHNPKRRQAAKIEAEKLIQEGMPTSLARDIQEDLSQIFASPDNRDVVDFIISYFERL